MGFVSSGSTDTTIQLNAFWTQKGRENLINNIDDATIVKFSLGDPDHSYMGSGGTTPLQDGDVPDITGDYSGCVKSIHCGIVDLRNKILRGNTEQFTREIKFKKNIDYINSGDTSWYRNINATIRLDRMIKYLILESSEGRQSGSTYDNTIKSPYADFFSEVAVIVSSNTTNLESIERKEIEYTIGNGSVNDRNYFTRFFNIVQTILDDPAVGIDEYPASLVDKREYPSPFVLGLSSYLSGNTLNIGGAGKGGLIIYPRALGYLFEVTPGPQIFDINKPKKIGIDKLDKFSTATFPVISQNKMFYRDIDLENIDFNLISQNGNDEIIPAAVIDTGFDGLKVFKSRNSILQDPDELIGPDEQDPNEIEKRFNNHYLRFYERDLIVEEIKLLGRFIKDNSNSGDNNRLFDIIYSGNNTTPINYVSRKPLVLIAKSVEENEKIGTVNIKFDLNVGDGINQGGISSTNPLGDLHNWTGITEGHLAESFVTY